MNAEKLKRLQEQVRIGGKGTARRKKKVTHQPNVSDDKKMQTSLKKIGMTNIPGIEEVNIIKDDLTVINFKNPKVQASISANTFAMTGHNEPKKVMDLLPDILPQLGQETVMQLRMYANAMVDSHKQLSATDNGSLDDDVPMLVEDFDEVARVESEKTSTRAQLTQKAEKNDKKEEKIQVASEINPILDDSNIQVPEQVNMANVQQTLLEENQNKNVGTSKPKETKKNKKSIKQNKSETNVIENVTGMNIKPDLAIPSELKKEKSKEEINKPSDKVKEVITEKVDITSELKSQKPIEIVTTEDNTNVMTTKNEDKTSEMKEEIVGKTDDTSTNNNQTPIEVIANTEDNILEIKKQESIEAIALSGPKKEVLTDKEDNTSKIKSQEQIIVEKKEKIEKNQKSKKSSATKDGLKESTTKKVDKSSKNKNRKPTESGTVKETKTEVITEQIPEIENANQNVTTTSENATKVVIAEKDANISDLQKLKPNEIAPIDNTINNVIAEKEDETVANIQNLKPNSIAKVEEIIKKVVLETEPPKDNKQPTEKTKETDMIKVSKQVEIAVEATVEEPKTIIDLEEAPQKDKLIELSSIQDVINVETNNDTTVKNEKLSSIAPEDKIIAPVGVSLNAADNKSEETKLELVQTNNEKLKETVKPIEPEQKQLDVVLTEKPEPIDIKAEVKNEAAIEVKPDSTGTAVEIVNQIPQEKVIVEKTIEGPPETLGVVQKDVIKTEGLDNKQEIQNSSSNVEVQVEKTVATKLEVQPEKSADKPKTIETIAEVIPEKSITKAEIQQKPPAETYAAALKSAEFQDMKTVIQPTEEPQNTGNLILNQESTIKSSAEMTSMNKIDAPPAVESAVVCKVETAEDPSKSKTVEDKLIDVTINLTSAEASENKNKSTSAEKEIITSKTAEDAIVDAVSVQMVTKVTEDKVTDSAKSKTITDTGAKKPQKNTEAKPSVNKNAPTTASNKPKVAVKKTETNKPVTTDVKKNNQKIQKPQQPQPQNKNLNTTAKPQITKPNVTANKSQEKPTEVVNPPPTKTTTTPDVATIAPAKQESKPTSSETESSSKPKPKSNPMPKAISPKATSPAPTDLKNKTVNARRSPDITRSQSNAGKPKQTVPKPVASTPNIGSTSTSNKTASAKSANAPKTAKPKQPKPSGPNNAAPKK